MDAESSWTRDEPVRSPFAHPRGLRGRLAGRFMALVNRRSSREVAALVPLRSGDTEAEGAGASQRAPASEERTARGSRPSDTEAEGAGASQRAPASEERTARGSRPSDTVLEVGFGPGVLLAALQARPERPVLVGVDPSAEMAEAAKRRVPEAEVRLGTADRTGLPDASVDHVVSVNTVAIWPDLDAGLDELCRVVRPGGTITLAWHGAHARSRISRSLALPEQQLSRIADGLAERCGAVERLAATDVVVFRATG